MAKLLWVDTETTGTDPELHGLIQVAMIAEIDGEIVGEFVESVNVFPGDKIEAVALAVNGVTEEEIAGYKNPQTVHSEMVAFLGKHINRYDPDDKFVSAGYNVGFDLGFLSKLFTRCNDVYLHSWITRCCLDILPVIRFLNVAGYIYMPDCKLSSACIGLGLLDFGTHDAMEDIKATRLVYQEILHFLGDPDNSPYRGSSWNMASQTD